MEDKHAFALYAALSKGPLRRSFTWKLLVVVFSSVHVPLLLGLIYLLTLTDKTAIMSWHILVLALVITGLGVLLSFCGLKRLLKPIVLTSRALRQADIEMLPTHFEDELGVLMRNAQQTVSRLDQLSTDFEQTALQDYLTGAYNRRAGVQRLNEDMARAQRETGIFALAFGDVDNFKQINDRYGHAFGDHSLRALVNTLHAQLRGGDWIARWGGDEFVVVLWDVDAEAAGRALARMCQALAQEPLQTDVGEPVTLRLSFGLCAYHSGMDAASLLECADQALYTVKAQGGGIALNQAGAITTLA